MIITQDVLNQLVHVSKYSYNEIEEFLSLASIKEQIFRFNDIWLNKECDAIYNPLRTKTDDEALGYFTPEDNWNEYSKEERLEKLKQSKQFLPNGWVNWNSYSLDQLVDYLNNKYRYLSRAKLTRLTG